MDRPSAWPFEGPLFAPDLPLPSPIAVNVERAVDRHLPFPHQHSRGGTDLSYGSLIYILETLLI